MPACEDAIGWGLQTDPQTVLRGLDAEWFNDADSVLKLCAQVRCPVLVMQGSADAIVGPERGPALAAAIPQAELVIRKGFHKDVDSYSAFTEADGKTTTGLEAYLKARHMKRLFVAGLATDFCVAWTALDARKAGFETYVVEDACRGIDTQGSLAKAWADMAKAGVKRIQSADIAV